MPSVRNGGDLAIAATLVRDLPVSPADMPRTRAAQMLPPEFARLTPLH
jgi:hypothetical protein